MRIDRLSLAEGARSARGVAIVIDVFRAFTCEPIMMHCGASRILLEASIERCLVIGRETEGTLLIGERDEEPIRGFDLTNSPSLLLAAGRRLLEGRTIVHRTTSGVTGAVIALQHCDTVFLASFVNARATAACVLELSPALISIVAMGIRTQAPAPEDEFCGDYLEALLTGGTYDHATAVTAILADETAQKFLRADKDHLPPADPIICLQRDLFNFALSAEPRGERIEAIVRCPGAK